MHPPPALEGHGWIPHQRVTEQLPELLDLVLDPDRAHLRLLCLLLLICGFTLALLPLDGRLSCLALPLRLSCLLLLGTS
ncbi:hypothetical protein AQJ54_35725 [Streptomyces griseorubiginosus]|uniref:Uncharacterized protein n=1 Tax=Streptomyces griseorubiginosus TaxID=67304 RepID=A0A101RS31_9ACTN|nr:hypothetical protein AQJ54_35725 [Streptomyces griseorubiginosus]